MVIANCADGTTSHFDLLDIDQHKELQDLIFSCQITALSLMHDGLCLALPIPKKFKSIPSFGVEFLTRDATPTGERIYVQADDVRVSLTLMYHSNLTRCDLVKTGRMQYNPRKLNR